MADGAGLGGVEQHVACDLVLEHRRYEVSNKAEHKEAKNLCKKPNEGLELVAHK